jgi:uncharacterized membrane protein
MTFAISLYDLSVWVHVSAVVVGLGATFVGAISFPLALRAGARHLPYAHELQLVINQRLTGPAFAIIILTGIYQTIDADWGFGSFWISATFAIVIVLGAMQGIYFAPTDRRLAELSARELEANGNVSDDYQRQARREALVGAVAGLLVIAAVFLMVTKPGA